MSDDLPFPDDPIETKDGWTVYQAPREADGQWIVNITDSRKPDWRDAKTFPTKEEADVFIKANLLDGVMAAIEDKKSAKPKRQGNYVNASYKIIELTPEQKKIVDDNFDLVQGNLNTLTQLAFGNNELDGRSTEGRSVKAYLIGLKKTPITDLNAPKKGKVELTGEQQTTIRSLLDNPSPPPVKEIVKLLFPDLKSLSPLCAEYRAVYGYVKSIQEEETDIWDEPVANRQYKPPVGFVGLIGRVNHAVSNPVDHTKAMYDVNRMKPVDEKNLRALVGYLKTPRFIYQASQYTKFVDRELFETSFIRYVHDKSADLTQSELDLYLIVAAKTVQASRLDRNIEKFEDRIDSSFEGDDDEKGTKSKLSMSLVEASNNLRDKLIKTEGQIADITKSLDGERFKRLKDRDSRNSTILNLFAEVIQEDTRNHILSFGVAEKNEDVNEVKRLKNMPAVLGLIAGMSEDEMGKG